MSGYSALFKCRLCGETFIAAEAGGRKAAERAAIYASMGKVSEEQAPDLHDIHICEDGGIGIADFLGFKERRQSWNT